MAKLEFRQPALLTDEEVSEVIARADELSKWAADVYAYAQDQAIAHGLSLIHIYFRIRRLSAHDPRPPLISELSLTVTLARKVFPR